jgi:hypothetical protein
MSVDIAEEAFWFPTGKELYKKLLNPTWQKTPQNSQKTG